MRKRRRAGRNLVAIIASQADEPAPHQVTHVYKWEIDRDNIEIAFQASFPFAHPGGIAELCGHLKNAWCSCISKVWVQAGEKGYRECFELKMGCGPQDLGLRGDWKLEAEY